MQDKSNVRVAIGASAFFVLACITALHACLLGVVFTSLHGQESPGIDIAAEVCCEPKPVGSASAIKSHASSPSMSAPVVNAAALNEIKQGWLSDRINGRSVNYGNQQCVDCVPNRVVSPSRPTYVPGYVQPGYVQPARPTVQPTVQPYVQPYASVDRNLTLSAPPRYQIAVFSDSSAKSNEVLGWFSRDSQLASLKAKCSWQVYSPENAVYRSRFAAIVPRDSFPAILFLQPDGGHIHAAGGNLLPSSAAQLYDDMQRSFRMYQSVQSAVVPRQATDSGATAISPAGSFTASNVNAANADCPDGYCPVPQDDSRFPWRPFADKKVNEQQQSFLSDLLWGGIQAVVLGIAVLFLGVLSMIVLVALVIKSLWR